MKKSILFLLVTSIFATSCLDKLAESPDSPDTDNSPEDVSKPKPSKKDDDEPVAKKSSEPEEKKDTRSFTQIREEKKDLEKRLKELTELAASEGDLITEEVKIASDAGKIRNYHAAATKLREELTTSVNAWKAATRTSFFGVELPEIETTNGNTYSSVTIQKIDDDTLTIDHAGGSETIPVINLPVALRKNIIHEATVLATKGL
ncbi:MAG: hypothetical protein P1U87_07300 [Verrucomicrobiales bacterium]|jgi:hypothetical protein|nr:hypothetical protein [Verrucomicrobiales bacterium]